MLYKARYPPLNPVSIQGKSFSEPPTIKRGGLYTYKISEIANDVNSFPQPSDKSDL